jgi:hypothetical protein
MGRRRWLWHHRRSGERMEVSLVRVNDLSRSVVSFEQSTTLESLIGDP